MTSVHTEERKEMGKQSWFYRLLKRIGLIKTYEVSKEQKAEMCRMACSHGVCPNACERCAWGERGNNVPSST